MASTSDDRYGGTADAPDEPGSGEVVDLDAVRTRRPANAADPDQGSDGGDGAEVVEGEVVARVDPPEAGRVGVVATALDGRPVDRVPVVPVWLRSREQARQVARWVVAHYTHTTAYHAARLPKYATKTVVRAPVGVWRLAAGVHRWVFDTEGAPLRRAAVDRANAEEYLKLVRLRNDRVRLRMLIVAAGTAVGLAGLLVLLGVTPHAARWAVLAVLAAVLGWAGSPADKPLVSSAVVSTPRAQRLTSEVVTRALGALGIAEINRVLAKNPRGISFVAPITRDGPGWRADVDLPYGVTVTDIIERRDRLASGLRRPVGCVWPEPAHDSHAGRLVLWVGDQDMSQVRGKPWPLARTGRADLFTPVPFGTDQRGHTVAVCLMFANVLIGAMPRFGKTFAMRVFILAAALDPTCELRVFELKGTGDLSAVEKVAHHYASGPDDATIEATVASLREVDKELERRAKTISGLPRADCPENKVTPQLAARRSLRLHPMVVGIDECQELFTHPEFGEEAGVLCTRIIKRGPALGIILILATQRPDSKSLPTGVSANAGIRLCLRVMGQVENDMVLGTSAYRNGIRATMFGPRDRGIGYLLGNADDPQIIRSYYIDAPTAEHITDRAHAARQAAGTLTGHAIGQTTPTRTDTLLEDILTVVPATEAKVWNETVVARMAAHNPDAYAGWEPETLTAALKPHGVTVGQVWGTTPDGKGANRRGITRDHITTAITDRNRKRDAG